MKKPANLCACLTVAFACSASPSLAEGSVKFLVDTYIAASPKQKIAIERKVADIENGMSWANTELEDRKAAKLYCVPQTFVATGSQIMDMLRRGMSEFPPVKEAPFGLGILVVLSRTFPCKSER